MFEDSLLESAGKLKRTNPGYAVLSFSLEVLLIGILILIPLIYTEALPNAALATFLVAPPPPPPPPPPAAAQVMKVRIESELDRGQLRQPTAIPRKVAILHEEDMAPPSSGVVGGVLGGVPGGSSGGVIGGVLGSLATPTAHVAPPKRITVSQGVTAGMVINKVQPLYPPLAKQARVQGQVVLAAIIGKDGTIQNLHVVSGHPMLVQSALDAVRQWRYKPYFLNGEPVEVDTTITVNFSLTGS